MQQSTHDQGPEEGTAPARRSPILRFIVGFLVLVGLFQLLILYVISPSDLFQGYLHLSARVSSMLLQAIGHDVNVDGSTLLSTELAIEVRRGCDGLAPASILAAAVLAFPGPIRSKLQGLLLGTSVILVANLVRISSLYLIGVYLPDHFQQAHHFTWPMALICLAMLCWMAWVTWLLPKPGAAR
ncbi:MAG: exosortase H (IPTLxxWG-CTERM-specific) [Chlamydiales bacterium]|jgi:exosortase H (IPTLxxWG-CTERM-specific)